MKVNIYYGGRGLIDDPTLFVLEKMEKVLDELRVSVERYNLYEEKSNIMVLPKTLKDVDGVILAASVEWYGYGGFLQQFFFGWCHVVWVVIIRHKLAVFNPQNAIHWLFTKGANLMDRHADFINRFDAIIFRQAGEKLR